MKLIMKPGSLAEASDTFVETGKPIREELQSLYEEVIGILYSTSS